MEAIATRRMDVTDVAKIARRILKEAFPDHKFSVTCDRYAGGQSIIVSYDDGPRDRDVNDLMRVLEGKRFDGRTDSSSYVKHIWEGEEVWFGADYIHVYRKLSEGFLSRTAQALWELEPDALNEILDGVYFSRVERADRRDARSLEELLGSNTDYVVRRYACFVGEVEPRGSVTATTILLANPFLHEEA